MSKQEEETGKRLKDLAKKRERERERVKSKPEHTVSKVFFAYPT